MFKNKLYVNSNVNNEMYGVGHVKEYHYCIYALETKKTMISVDYYFDVSQVRSTTHDNTDAVALTKLTSLPYATEYQIVTRRNSDGP